MVAPVSLMAEKHEYENGLYWELNGSTLTISGNGKIPEYGHSRWDKKAVEKLVIEDGVTSIGGLSFCNYDNKYYPNLKSVIIGNTVTSIGEYSFIKCNLTDLSIGNSVTTIGEMAFQDCTSLTTISIPNSVTTIGDYAFSRCTSLTTIQSLPIWVIERGESEWFRIRLPKDAVYKYLFAHQDEEGIRPFALKKIKEDEFKAKGGYNSVRLVNDGGTEYYIVSKNDHYGLTGASGQVIVPAELDDIQQCGKGFLRFRMGGFWGVINYTGKIIIPTDRGYTKIGDYVSFTKRFPYEMVGFKGECNNLGQQVSKIKATTQQASTAASSSNKGSSNNTRSAESRAAEAELELLNGILLIGSE